MMGLNKKNNEKFAIEISLKWKVRMHRTLPSVRIEQLSWAYPELNYYFAIIIFTQLQISSFEFINSSAKKNIVFHLLFD